MPKEGELFLGIDGGGTKTVCAVSDASGRILGLGASTSTNYHNVGQRRTLLSIRKAVEAASEAAGVSSNHFDSACVGLPALDSPADIALMTCSVKSMKLSRLILVTNDWRIALVGAFVGGQGVMVIAGTGSVAAGANTQGKITRVGGWGSVVDDRGSAYDIGKDALYWAMRAHDARGPSTVLLRKLMKRMRVKEPEGLIEKVYLGKMEIAEIASLSTIVAQAAKGGDGVSRHLLEEKGALLGELAVTAARRVSILRRKFGVAPVGGVFRSGPILRDAFERRIKASAPLADVVRPILQPVCGAILLSLKMAGANVDEVVIRHLQALQLLVGQDFMRTQGGLTSKTLVGYS